MKLLGVYSDKSCDIDLHFLSEFLNDIISKHDGKVFIRDAYNNKYEEQAIVIADSEITGEEADNYLSHYLDELYISDGLV